MNKPLFIILAAVSLSMLASCSANFPAVRAHSKASIDLTKAFTPLLNDTLTQCRERFARKHIYSATLFDLQALQQDTKEACDIYSKPNESILAINQALALYADKLAALAGDDLAGQLNPSLDTLANSVKSVPFPDGANATADRIDAINRLAKFLAQQTVGHRQKAELAEALQHEDAVNTLVDTLSFYVNTIYRTQLDSQLSDINSYRQYLAGVKDSKSPGERFSTRHMLVDFQQDERRINAKLAAIPTFIDAANQMKASQKSLRNQLDHADSQEQVMQVIAFAEEVRALNSTLQQAF